MTPDRPNQGRRTSGFTLVELLVAMAASVVLISAMGSLIVITSSAIPDGSDRGSLAADAAHTLERIADDVTFATTVTPADGRLTLEVPDRTGNGNPEPIVYWLASGGALKRGKSTSDSSAVTVMTGVVAFITERDSGTGAVRTVRIAIAVVGLGTIETSAETVARPAG